MKNKIISIILLSVSLSITGCGTQQASVEPTEVVIETETEEPTETEEVAVETETPPTDYNALYPGFSSENITINEDGTKEYSEAFYDQCKNYKCFEGATHEEIANVVAIYMPAKFDYTPEQYHKQFSMLDDAGIKASDILDTSASTSNASSNKNNESSKNNSSQTNNNQATTPPDTTDPTGGYGNVEDTPSTPNNTSSEAPVTSEEVEAALNNLGLYDNSAIGANGNPREWGPQLEQNSHLDWQ